MFEISRDQLELFSLSEEERNIIFGSPGVCSDLSLPRQITETKVKHKRSLICGFRFLIWASGRLMFCKGYICRTPNGRRARINYFGFIGNLVKPEGRFWHSLILQVNYTMYL